MTTATMTGMEPEVSTLAIGLHEGVPNATYQRIDAASNSRLGWLKKSPAHLRAYIDHPPEPTSAQDLGQALHTLVFEPVRFNATYVQGPVNDRRVKEWKAFEAAQRPGVACLKPAEWETVHSMAAQIYEHPAARLALSGMTAIEVTGIWEDAETGVKCKLRADGINPALGAVIDLKSTVDASERAFARAIYNYGYYRQGAMYLTGMNELQDAVEYRHHIVIAQEKEPPYAVAAYRIRDDAIEAGLEEIANLLPRYAECHATGVWPGYATEFVDVSLPPWTWAQLDDEKRRSA